MSSQKGFISSILVITIVLLLILSIYIGYKTYFLANKDSQLTNRSFSFSPSSPTLSLPSNSPSLNSNLTSSVKPVSSSSPQQPQSASPQPSVTDQDMSGRRAQDLKAIAAALQVYHTAYGFYPDSGDLNGGQNALPRSECPQWGGYPSDQVVIDLSDKHLPALVPRFMSVFPSDPQMDKVNNIACYIYLSNGTDYKIRTSGVNIRFMPAAGFNSQPSLIDPKYNGQSSPCGDTNTSPTAWAIASSDVVKCW